MRDDYILVVDDEEDILELIEYNLSKEGYSIECVTSGEAALDMIKQRRPKLILLDLMLPGTTGIDVCKIVKQHPNTRQIPIVIVSARGEEADIVTSLELGADDYITKPFSPRILMARIRALLRRKVFPSNTISEEIFINGLIINIRRHEATLDGQPLALSPTEFAVLTLLAKEPGRAFTRQQIVVGVHGTDYPVTNRSVDVQIASLRRKLGKYEYLVETMRGVGYRFKD